MKHSALILIVLFLSACKTTVEEYNSPKSFSNGDKSVEVWMNDDGLNNAIFLSINTQVAWQRKSLQGGAMSVFLPEGENSFVIRMLYTEFMEFPVDKEISLKSEFSPEFKYVFVSKYDEKTKVFLYRFEKIDKNSKCKFEPTNFKRIITGKLICTLNGQVYKFT
jgi:hypothetical protein